MLVELKDVFDVDLRYFNKIKGEFHVVVGCESQILKAMVDDIRKVVQSQERARKNFNNAEISRGVQHKLDHVNRASVRTENEDEGEGVFKIANNLQLAIDHHPIPMVIESFTCFKWSGKFRKLAQISVFKIAIERLN